MEVYYPKLCVVCWPTVVVDRPCRGALKYVVRALCAFALFRAALRIEDPIWRPNEKGKRESQHTQLERERECQQ